VRFRRKSAADEATLAEEAADATDAGPVPGAADQADEAGESGPSGPFDIEELPTDGVARVDLGSLLVAPGPGRDLRVQVDQKSGSVRSVMLAGPDGALELRAFAAPRHGDLWSEIRPQIAADATRKGGTATEREGRFGTELLCELQVPTKEGGTGTQTSRVIGINGPRWLLRATFLGRPAREPDAAPEWESAITQVAVRRGTHPMPVGEQLPLTLPEGARVPQAGDAADDAAPGGEQ
jgi:uncharacterized protein DUF3710